MLGLKFNHVSKRGHRHPLDILTNRYMGTDTTRVSIQSRSWSHQYGIVIRDSDTQDQLWSATVTDNSCMDGLVQTCTQGFTKGWIWNVIYIYADIYWLTARNNKTKCCRGTGILVRKIIRPHDIFILKRGSESIRCLFILSHCIFISENIKNKINQHFLSFLKTEMAYSQI